MNYSTFFRLLHVSLGFACTTFGLPSFALAETESHASIDLTTSAAGYFAIGVFVLAYALVMSEEVTHLRKSKPVIFAAGIIWGAIALAYPHGQAEVVENAFRHNLMEYAELMLFLLVAMTYINALDERLVFVAIRSWLVRKAFTYRQLFWITGILSFFISSLADNLTTALLMCAVVLAVGAHSPKFVNISCINIVVAANAGGAFCPFGDITTLMVWQKGILGFFDFFQLFVPAMVNFLVPAAFMHYAIPRISPPPSSEIVRMKTGAKRILGLFLLTICTAVGIHNFLHLPPVLGMMTGFAYLGFFGHYLNRKHTHSSTYSQGEIGDVTPFDVFQKVARAEWDTLLFFYGVVMCVGGLGQIGYMALTSHVLYTQWGPTFANISIGLLSAIIDNIPIMFAVLTMHPDISEGQWLLVTMTAGVGGSLLSIGSAAGVALMGQAKGVYTFFSHLKWTPAIAVGYAASILVHMWINARTF